ncbi:MAG: hypothetical protein ACT4TC_09595, partial [Myxococcaceae bacterium]
LQGTIVSRQFDYPPEATTPGLLSSSNHLKSLHPRRQNRDLHPTKLGVLDVLGSVPPVGDFARVASAATTLDLFGRPCKVISLDDLITVKHAIGRPKDLQTEQELKAIRDRVR